MAFWVKDDPCPLPVWRVVCDMEPTFPLPERLCDERLEASSTASRGSGSGVVPSEHPGKDISGSFSLTWPLLLSTDILPSVAHCTAPLPTSPVWCPKFSFIQKNRKWQGSLKPNRMLGQREVAEGINSESQHFLPSRFVRQFGGIQMRKPGLGMVGETEM